MSTSMSSSGDIGEGLSELTETAPSWMMTSGLLAAAAASAKGSSFTVGSEEALGFEVNLLLLGSAPSRLFQGKPRASMINSLLQCCSRTSRFTDLAR